MLDCGAWAAVRDTSDLEHEITKTTKNAKHEEHEGSSPRIRIPCYETFVSLGAFALQPLESSSTARQATFALRVLRGTLGGIVLGTIALFLPLVLFSGQHQLQQAYDQAAQLGFWVLLLTGLSRLFLTNLLLATGWKGGQFMPIMFGGVALGLSLYVLFPVIPAPVAALGSMAALVAVVMPKPIIALAIMVMMFPVHFAGVSAIAVALAAAGQQLCRRCAFTGNPARARIFPETQ